MQIEDLVPVPGDGESACARFAVRLNQDVKLIGFRLRRRPDGSYRIRPPSISGNASAHFAPPLNAAITRAAAAAFERRYALASN